MFHVLIKNRLLSAPVYDENAQDYTWVVDITDILEAALVFTDEAIPRKTSTAFKELNSGCSSSNDLFKNVELEAVFGMPLVHRASFIFLITYSTQDVPARGRLIVMPLTASLFDVVTKVRRL